jgi:hypothetical protein
MKKLLFLHRWLGVIACVAVLMFAGSGLLHPIMSRTQPQPLERIAPVAGLSSNVIPLAEVLRRARIEQFAAATVIALPSGAAYRVQIDADNVHYFWPADGTAVAEGERHHAELLARHFSGEHRAALTELIEIKNFDADYLAVNRLLPVWRARFAREDGLTVYVDTRGNRLATLVDNRKRLLQTTFRNMHDFAFVESQPGLRLALMLILLTATFVTAAAGLTLFVRLKNPNTRLRKEPLRRWHRRLALLVSLTTFSFSISGTWHLLQGEFGVDSTIYSMVADKFLTSELTAAQPSTPFALMRVADTPCYRQIISQENASRNSAPPSANSDEHAHHAMPAQQSTQSVATSAGATCVSTVNGQPLADAERIKAEELARQFAHTDAAVRSSEKIDRFSGEYGFINKRLPVWKLQFDADNTIDTGNTRWYVETDSGALALRADDSAALEGFIFAYVHKWTFFGDHKDIRDALMMLFALGNIVIAALGLQLFIGRVLKTATDK